jgi:ABC-type transport system involved in multi-copper enzyme maturation permease subunit
MVGGELFKITRLRVTWVMAILFAGLITGPQLIFLAAPRSKDQIHADPLGLLYTMMEVDLSLIRIFAGIFLLILAAYVVGLEYQQGTIRVLLGRGVARLQLLGAKALALLGVAVALLLGGLLIEALMGLIVVAGLAGNLTPLQSLTSQFWSDAWLYLVSVMISTGVTLLLGVAVTVVGRSLAFGLGVGLGWFAADNLGVLIMFIAYRFTGNDFWRQVTGYFLGPILNDLPALIVPSHTMTVQTEKGLVTMLRSADTVGSAPLANIDATHALVVIGIYAVVFAAVAIVLTWRRDVLE